MSSAGRRSLLAGRVIFGKDQELIGKREDEIVKLGIGRKFQAPSIYANLTVWENLDLSLKRPSKGVFSTLLGDVDGGGTGEDQRDLDDHRPQRLRPCQGRLAVARAKAVARNRHGNFAGSLPVAGG